MKLETFVAEDWRRLPEKQRRELAYRMQVNAGRLILGETAEAWCSRGEVADANARRRMADKLLEIAAELNKTLNWGAPRALPKNWNN